MNWLQKVWYQEKINLRVYGLLPLSMLFYLASAVRRWAFRIGLKASTRVAVPVVIVGNISVGGNGKTPLVILLAQWLRQAGFSPGVLSRGYGGKGTAYPISVDADSDAVEVGDEAALMRQHLPCPLVVDPKRVRGAQALIDKHKCNVILCDDGLQHYALKRDIEIVVVDGERRHGNACLLPMGPLREGLWRLKHVDFVVINGGRAQADEELMTLESGHLINVKYPNRSKSLSELHNAVTAVAAIGNPDRFFRLLKARQIVVKQCLSFVDHHQFKPQDIPTETVIMTEKDAVKCRRFAHEDWWYLPVSAKLSENFKQALLVKLKQLTR